MVQPAKPAKRARVAAAAQTDKPAAASQAAKEKKLQNANMLQNSEPSAGAQEPAAAVPKIEVTQAMLLLLGVEAT
jgi:hypothetical protein